MNAYLPSDFRAAFPTQVPREKVRDKLLEVLGLEKIPTAVEFALEGTEETADGLIVSHVTFPNSLGETVSGILSVPQGAPRHSLAGIVCMPGTSQNEDTVGHSRFYRQQGRMGRLIGWGRELSRHGFATLSLSVKGCRFRSRSGDWNEETLRFAPYGRTQIGIIVEETVQAALVLSATEQVDPLRIGLTGMSLGGMATWYTLACAPWISAGASVCGVLGSMERLTREHSVSRHSFAILAPPILRYFDHPEIIASCVPPRPFMMVAPTLDEDMPRSGVEDLIRLVEPAYQSAGYPERFKVYQPETNHVFTMPFFEWMVAWFKRFLADKVE